MKTFLKIVLVLILAAAAVGGLIFAFSQMSKERAAESEGEKPITAESRVKRNAAGEVQLTLDKETQVRIELKVEPVVASRLSPEAKGYGQVLDPAPLVALVTDLAAAEVALAASQQEFTRLKTMIEQGNASTRALQTAEATAVRDQLQARSLREKLLLGWGKAIAEQKDLPAFVQSLAARQRVLVRIDVPAGEAVSALPAAARIVPVSSERALPAQTLGPAPNVALLTQGQGFLFLVDDPNPVFWPGQAVIGYLQLPGEAVTGVTIPRSAVVRHAGEAWIYVQTGAETFGRRKITLDHPLANGWFINGTVTATDRVVLNGAQTLLSEEQKSQIKLVD